MRTGSEVAVLAGLAQPANAPPSSLQATVAASLTLNGTEAPVPEIDGFPIVTFGAVVSTTNVLVALPTLPTASFAVTLIEWLPSDRPAYAFGLVQSAAAPPSSEHCTAPVLPAAVNVAVAVLPATATPSVTVGASVSVVNATSTLSSRGVTAPFVVPASPRTG